MKKILIKNFSKYLRFLAQFKLETQLKILTHIVDENRVGIKDAITIISSLNTFQKLLVSEVLKLVRLMLTVPANLAQIQNLPATIYDSRTSKFLFNSCNL